MAEQAKTAADRAGRNPVDSGEELLLQREEWS